MRSKFVFLGIVILFIAVAVSCHKEDAITLNKTSLSLENGRHYASSETGDTVTLIATTSYSNKKIIWKSSNPNVATITADGLVRAISKGKATITASVQNRKQAATCSVTVADYRERWVGDWDFVVREDELVLDGVMKKDTSYYLGKITLGNASNDLNIQYTEYKSMTVTVLKGGLIFNSTHESPSGKFDGSNGMHLNVVSKTMSGSRYWSLDIEGVKKEEYAKN